ncbi:MAG: DUF4982 domain-containing protein, partial [Clostridiales bacterium]|nr:DUF4982 domain-containing protein [Clostridiales bacterium]
HPFWDYPAHRGKPVKIDVYSRAPTVELLLNGRSLGRRGAGKAAGYVAPFEALYEDGELTAISLDGSGAEISRHTLSTPGKFASLAVEMGEPVGDIIYADISAVDAAGRLVPFDDKRVRATVGGCGELIAFGSGRPATDEGFTSGVATTYLGRAQAVIRVNRGSDGGGADGGAGNMGGADGANGANGAGSAGVAVAGGGAGNAGNAGRPTLTVEIA